MKNESTRSPARPTILLLRAAVFFPVVLYMLWSPVDAHLKPGGKKSIYSHGWMFFRGYGEGICDVRYTLTTAAGDERPLDRYATLGYNADNAPTWLKQLRLGHDAEVPLDRVTKRLCNALGARAQRLRVQARCATRSGWKTVAQGHEPVCRMMRQRRGRKK